MFMFLVYLYSNMIYKLNVHYGTLIYTAIKKSSLLLLLLTLNQ